MLTSYDTYSSVDFSAKFKVGFTEIKQLASGETEEVHLDIRTGDFAFLLTSRPPAVGDKVFKDGKTYRVVERTFFYDSDGSGATLVNISTEMEG